MYDRYNILFFFNKDCVLIINFNNIRFIVGDVFVFLIILKDYSRKFMVLVVVYYLYKNLIGRIIVLVCFVIFKIICDNKI